MMNLLSFFLLVVQTHSVTPVIHTLQYFTTASSQVPNFPEYVEVGYVDEVETSYYDSNIRKAESKQDWMNKITAEDPNYCLRETEINVVRQHVLKDNVEILKKRFNQTGGVHTYQEMSGCEWNDETEVKGWEQHSYDGEDFISLDMKTWTAAKQQAFPSKLKLDQDIFLLDIKYYYTELCPSYLKKYVEYGKKVLMRTASLSFSIFFHLCSLFLFSTFLSIFVNSLHLYLNSLLFSLSLTSFSPSFCFFTSILPPFSPSLPPCSSSLIFASTLSFSIYLYLHSPFPPFLSIFMFIIASSLHLCLHYFFFSPPLTTFSPSLSFFTFICSILSCSPHL
ncbi:class I histocompatibility antigen, F10 alpha chain-like isoform X1 [Nerophis ophidion]|uniref:class I histocompatibility antigen, F10 alpha chain-like isoform X1 n=1 Tax=Nerophis ophidion TaxID=159077 RepID=UPI002AE0128A|nr:class I histocompatibility antigen, F10 alpha chain-like isoform X1 [Nerophis ophidion]